MDKQQNSFSRRSLLATGAVGGLLTPRNLLAAPEDNKNVNQNVYRQLGVKPIINAAGTITTLGGSLMPPEVLAAWNAAAASYVDLLELQDRVGERIAEMLGVEAALVTTGAAGGIVLGTAAALTYRDHSLVSRLPFPAQQQVEVIRQRSHHACYDNQVRACGARLVDVESRQDLEQAINGRTAMMFGYNVNEGDSTIPQEEWVEVARTHDIPTLIDAAADTPPLDALWKYNQMGFDMVVFSGGKAIRGPQDAGLLLGRKDLIAAAKLNTAPRCGNIGRGMKVSKEDMVAMWAAIRRYINLDHAAEHKQWQQCIDVIVQSVADLPSVTTRCVVPPIANHVPHLLVFWDESRLRITRDEVQQKLADDEPSIATARVHGTGDEGFLISVFMLQPGEEQVVGQRLRRILEQSSR
ncbi:MAG TPA: aminotransferase class V-fold PLP-dependent enzyme [Pirellulaceae bacterium]|jgi:L-seryl-tRNA(Ser) seleniumtransferase|nr:aminotransferase class V-fold PLP-dependent enzyme [Pirellulaceae bacterium]